ncbi:glycosyltransferase [Flavobacteriaceae bacterium]|nr:glycosyltransferase [Flavobacteriaceae bacterium]
MNIYCFFGLIREYKGLETLIKSMPKVLKLNPNLKLLIVGENYISMKKYKLLIKKLDISKSIIIKNTFIDDDKIKYWFSSSELVIIPYKKASQSGITSLSLQFEVPTVSSNIDGLNEVINDNITGYLFDMNFDELAAKINYALKSDKNNIVNNIIKLKKELTWDSFVTQILKNI